MSPEQAGVARVVLSAIAEECEASLVATLSESHLKVVAVNALLSSGFAIIEGGGGMRGKGKRIQLIDGALVSEMCDLPSMRSKEGSGRSRSSPDIRVVYPTRLTVELQARSVHGSQSVLFSENILDDLRRIHEGRADLFVIAVDNPIYDALRGDKRSTRGRKAMAPGLLKMLLPEPSSLPNGFLAMPEALEPHLLPFGSCAVARDSVGGVGRIVAAVWSEPSAIISRSGPERGSALLEAQQMMMENWGLLDHRTSPRERDDVAVRSS